MSEIPAAVVWKLPVTTFFINATSIVYFSSVQLFY
jgi:hypothetical protein